MVRVAVKEFENVELIQQWQYLGKVHPKMLKDSVFEVCKKIGLTSVQSYVYWAEIEKEKGKIDFSPYDVLIEKLKRHKLKWVPFLILGPQYATPEWFWESGKSVFAKCLEHGMETRIQSIWNPYLPEYVERFLQMIAKQYRNCGILESVTLGISGNWGEALYPAWGGFYGGFHTHPGWWCGDRYAVLDFKKYAKEKYQSIDALNLTWGTSFGDFKDLTFPYVKRFRIKDFLRGALKEVFSIAPHWLKPLLSSLWRAAIIPAKRANTFSNPSRFSSDTEVSCSLAPEQLRWLDFVEWYLQSMTRWAEFWLKKARQYFPDTPIYLVTGGDGKP
ncbi:MAG: beta-galactosidase, partial [Nitrososphaeria archaeon]